jgi:selenocysteine-specific elongation factor
MAHVVYGTAGHIDHGKTSLVRALTGVDCDRLPEEQERGITIDLGFARLDDDGTVLHFVDVPGHERLVHTMIAGASGIDLALLVVAADEGVMPQTLEHMEVIRLMGVPGGRWR